MIKKSKKKPGKTKYSSKLIDWIGNVISAFVECLIFPFD